MGPKDRPKEPFPAKQRSFKGTGVDRVSSWVPWALSSALGWCKRKSSLWRPFWAWPKVLGDNGS